MATSTTDATAIINNNTNQFPSSTILPPRLIISNKIDDGSCSGDDEAVVECSVHTLPKPLVREFHHVFAEKYLETTTATTTSSSSSSALDLLAIPTNQKARMDLVNIGDHVEQEKDRLLNTVSFDFLCLHSRILATPFLFGIFGFPKTFFFFHSHFSFFLWSPTPYSYTPTSFSFLLFYLQTHENTHYTLHSTTTTTNQPTNQPTKTKISLSILPKIFVTNLGHGGIGQILSIRVLDCL